MIPKENNYAYIDGANLHKGIKSLGWNMDYARLRIWLSEKYAVKRAYLFIGMVPKFNDLYKFLQEVGYTLVFKETVRDSVGNIKGNCDADLVLQAARDYYEHHFDRAVLVSSDGDYACLVKFFHEKDKMRVVLSPGNRCSILIKRTNVPIVYLDNKYHLLAKNKKAPNTDGTA